MLLQTLLHENFPLVYLKPKYKLKIEPLSHPFLLLLRKAEEEQQQRLGQQRRNHHVQKPIKKSTQRISKEAL